MLVCQGVDLYGNGKGRFLKKQDLQRGMLVCQGVDLYGNGKGRFLKNKNGLQRGMLACQGVDLYGRFLNSILPSLLMNLYLTGRSSLSSDWHTLPVTVVPH